MLAVEEIPLEPQEEEPSEELVAPEVPPVPEPAPIRKRGLWQTLFEWK